ncbi:hypothetical protein Hanom_Chr16g01478361 [Helianthus anomalus]
MIDMLHSWPLWTNNLQKANILAMLFPKLKSCKRVSTLVHIGLRTRNLLAGRSAIFYTTIGQRDAGSTLGACLVDGNP